MDNNQIMNSNEERDNYLKTMRDIANEYGVHVDLIDGRNGIYLVACPHSEKITDTPEEIINRKKSNEDIFYPNEFAINILDNNSFSVAETLIEYCMKTEFVHTIFRYFEVDVPDKLRETEVYGLINCNDRVYDPNMPDSVKLDYSLNLNEYFKKQEGNGVLRSQWKDFFRSERYDEDASLLKNLSSFFNKRQNEVDIDVLLETNSLLKTHEMYEYEYQLLKEDIKDIYPEVSYSVGKKTVVDHGQLKVPEHLKGQVYNPWEDEESYFEYRKITFKAADEPKIANVYNSIRYKGIQDYSLSKLEGRGQVSVISIPAGSFRKFASLLKDKQIPFHIDKGEMATPDLNNISVVYNAYNQEKIEAVLNYMIFDKVCSYHAVKPDQVEKVKNMTVNQRLKAAEQVRLSKGDNCSKRSSEYER